ncbi:MAG: metallophosphoesterase, partial [Clostridia bacterium]|nr:metallophosphoesterase [Clostridia bacterium]
MAIYVTSDLHGTELSELKTLLEKANFSDRDWLFILGDVIDRNGDGGVEILEWLLYQPNAQLILGNHEAMLLSCAFLFEEVTEDSVAKLTTEQMELLENYRLDGGDVTLMTLAKKNKEDRDTVLDILDYLREAPLYETVSAGGKDFVLVHGGLENFRPDKKLSEYTADELIWCWPELDDTYFEDAVTVFGHTPTLAFDPAMKGKILKTR